MKKTIEKLKETRFAQFILELVRRIQEDQVMAVGAQLAYHLVMSFFPFLLFLLNLAAFTPLGQETVINELFSILPRETAELIVPIIMDIATSKSATLLSVSIVLALWSGSNGINALIVAMGKAFDIENNHKPWLKRLLSLLYTFLLAIIILLTLMGPIFGESIVNALQAYIPVEYIIRIVVALLPIPVMIFGFAGIYKWGPGFPENNKITFREALFGSFWATILFIVVSFGFSFYVNNFSNYANTYGTLGGIIILLIWLYLASSIIMLGAEISATLVAFKRNTIEKRTDPETPEKQSPPKAEQVGLGSAIFGVISLFGLTKLFQSIFKR